MASYVLPRLRNTNDADAFGVSVGAKMANKSGRWMLAACSMLAGLAASQASAQSASTPAFRVPLGTGNASSSAPPVYAWLESISECSSVCGSGTRTTSFQCQNASDFDYSGTGYGAPEADALCTSSAGPKPVSTNSSCTNYSGCGYDWVKPPVQQTPVQISPNPIGRVGCGKVRTVFSPYCQRTGGASAVVLPSSDHRFCRNDTPDYNQVAAGDVDALGYDREIVQLGSCTPVDHEWRTGAYGTWNSTCSNAATQTRSVTCYRRFDNQAVVDSSCDQGAKPAASNTQPVYTSCSYDWIGGDESNWSTWSSTCSNSATRTRNPQCRRSNGDVVADAECVSRGKAKPTASQSQPVYTGCTYAAGGTTTYGAWSSQCSSSAQRSATRQCVRSNGDVVADAECSNRGIALTSSQTQAVYDQCGYSFATGGWSDWNSRCSSSATRTRSVSCRRSDGTTLPDQECTNRGVARPASSETQAVYDQCGYVRGDYTGSSDWNSHCSGNAVRTNYFNCKRGDGAVVDSSLCTSRGVAVTEQQGGAVYDQCGYNFVPSAWSDWSSHCSASARRTRAVWCYRSDGTMMDPDHSACYNAGRTYPGYEEYAGVYDGCGYARGDYTGSSDWNSHCSGNAVRTNNFNCKRSDGAVVGNAECTNRGISVTEQQGGAVYDQCGYTPVNWTGFSACQNNQQSSTAQCQRSDGAIVANAECDNRGQSTTRTQSCQSEPSEGYGTCNGGSVIGGVQVDNTPPNGSYFQKWGSYQYPPKPAYFDQQHFLAYCRAAGGSCVQTSSYVVAYGPDPWSPAWTRSTMECKVGNVTYTQMQPTYDENTGEYTYPGVYYHKLK